ncbi:MAG: T3SS (YopN, CesT) and YbjN peptide-binding chaperone 1 [Micromonosporaceae bacterium]
MAAETDVTGPPAGAPSGTPRVAPGEPAATARLLDDPATADLKAKVDAAWEEFARALGSALGQLPAGVQLDLTLDPTAAGTGEAVYEVGLSMADDKQLYGEAVGNASLPDGHRLDRAAVADLVALGWSPPGVVERSGNRFGLQASAEDASRVAAAVTRTLRDVYGAPHPAFLTYEVSGTRAGAAALLQGAAEGTIELPPLGSARPAPVTAELAELGDTAPIPVPAPVDFDLLTERVRTVVAALQKTSPETLQTDEDGDIGIRAGSAMVFVRVHRNPALVDVYSPLLTEVEPNERLYERLSQLTRRMPIGRLYYTEGTIWASVPVFGRDFAATHLVLAVQVMTALADELDDRLQGDFGGKRFFGEGDKPPGSDGERTGMYL